MIIFPRRDDLHVYNRMISCMPAILIHSRFDIDLFCWFLFFFFGGGYLTQKDQPKVGFLLMFIYHITTWQSFEHKLFNDTDNNVIDTFYIWYLSVTDADSQRFTKLNNLWLFPIIICNDQWELFNIICGQKAIKIN